MLMEVSSLLAARTLISFEIRLILSRIEMILPGMSVHTKFLRNIVSLNFHVHDSVENLQTLSSY